MKPSEMLRVAGKPIAYYPELAKPLGGVNASILFSHFFYWHDKTRHELGIYRTAEEIEIETGLSVQEQRTARNKLKVYTPLSVFIVVCNQGLLRNDRINFYDDTIKNIKGI